MRASPAPGPLGPWVVGVVGVVACAGCGGDVVDGGCDPFVVDVVSYDPGDGGGFNAERLPAVVQGEPVASDDENGGTLDVVSLGKGGAIVVELGCAVRDGDGVDFIVFENAFAFAGGVNTEAGVVGVSSDGEEFVDYACDAPAYADDGVDGCAGMAVGGDEFDLATVGADDVEFVRVRDRGDGVCCGGDGKGGFDLDAVIVVNR